MQSDEEALSEINGRSPMSVTSFPKQLPTNTVDVNLNESCDDLVIAHQRKQSPQGSTNSITPTNSLKMFGSNLTVKSILILNVPENTSNEQNESSQKNDLTVFEGNSSKQEIHNTITDEIVNNKNETKTSNYSITNNETSKNKEKLDQPEIIFNAINYSNRIKQNKFLKRKSKIYKSVKTKWNKFKCKPPKNSLCYRLEKYYKKTKENSIKSGLIHHGFSNISTVVSRTGVLKKVLAKENLLEESEPLTVAPNKVICNLNKTIDGSLSSHTSTVKNGSFISNSSGRTLTCQSSVNSLKPQNSNILGNIDSVIKKSPSNTSPFKNDVINVNVSVAYNKTKVSATEEIIFKTEELICLGNLTSTETLTVDLDDLTSKNPSYLVKTTSLKRLKPNEISSNTLKTNRKSSFGVSSDDDTYDMARTSSEFDESNSTYTLENHMEEIKDLDVTRVEEVDDSIKKKPTVLQTVIDLESSEVTPSTSSAGVLCTDQNSIVITENASYVTEIKNMGDSGNKHEISKKLLKELFNEQNMSPGARNINIPKQIKTMLTESNFKQQKCFEESKLYPSILPEIWERLILVLDVAFKRLEESLTDTIIKEMKKTLATPDIKRQHDIDLEKGDVEPPPPNKTIPAQNFNRQTNVCLQCDLIPNRVLDQIMLKLCMAGPTILKPETSVSARKLKPKMFRDYLESLKSPAVVDPEVTDNGDAMTISTVAEELGRFRRLLFGPLQFIKENAFVITSVPAFLVVLLFVYGLLMLVIKPW